MTWNTCGLIINSMTTKDQSRYLADERLSTGYSHGLCSTSGEPLEQRESQPSCYYTDVPLSHKEQFHEYILYVCGQH